MNIQSYKINSFYILKSYMRSVQKVPGLLLKCSFPLSNNVVSNQNIKLKVHYAGPVRFRSAAISDGPMIYNRKSVGLGLPIATIDSKMQQSIVIGSGTQSTCTYVTGFATVIMQFEVIYYIHA